MSVATDVLARWRRIVIVGEDVIPEAAITIPRPDGFHDGKPFWKSSSGLDLLSPPRPELDIPKRLPGHSSFVGDPEISPGAIPEIAKIGGKVLGAAGVVLTLGGTWAGQWSKDEQAHPEWSEDRRVESAVTSTVIVGGTSVAGGAVGAVIGGAIGTALFPGVGSVVGAFVGGAIGGWVGGKGVEMAGDWLLDKYNDSGAANTVHSAVQGGEHLVDQAKDGVEHVWKGLFG